MANTGNTGDTEVLQRGAEAVQGAASDAVNNRGFIGNFFSGLLSPISSIFNGLKRFGILGAAGGAGLGYLTNREGGGSSALRGAGYGAAAAGGLGVVTNLGESFTGGGVAKFLGAGIAFAGVAAVAIGAIGKQGNIRHDAGGEREVTPPAPPRRDAAPRNHADV